ncbi:hypothetical protein HS125_08875 [bacterium]|nr:hypothetical protein [bacterium]
MLSAEWNDEEQGIDLVLVFEPSGVRLRGQCRAGTDPETGHTVSPAGLKAQLPKIRSMKVYWNGPASEVGFDPARLRNLVIHLDLAGSQLGVREGPAGPDANAFLSRILR